MTVLDRVRDFIVGRSPEATCDDCIADALHLSARQHASRKTRILENLAGFHRRVGECLTCHRGDKKVIWYG